MTPRETVRRFVACINAHDLAALSTLISSDHRFLDSLGTGLSGREAVRDAWRRYFEMIPDYRIEVARTFVNRGEVALLGSASGTVSSAGGFDPADAWRIPAAWRAVVRGDVVAEWQVYADNSPVRARGSEHARRRIHALDEAWKAAAQQRDLDGMLAIYAPDARELLPGLPPLAGHEEIRAFYQSLFESLPRLRHDFEATDVMIAGSGDLAVVRGSYQFSPDAATPEPRETGKFVGVWRFRDGDWRLVLNISNDDGSMGGRSAS